MKTCSKVRQSLLNGFTASLALCGLGLGAHSASAAETRGYVVTWFHIAPAAQPTDVDCPRGVNPDAEKNFIRWLKELNKTDQEIEEALADFPNNMYGIITTRGRINGEPANVYQNPSSVPDPMVSLVESKIAYGFNLDGAVSAEDFTDPFSGEQGVDNQVFRALGCFGAQRGELSSAGEFTARPLYPAIQWEHNRDQAAAWLIEVNGIDDMQNDDDVYVQFVQATRPVVKDASGEPQADMTFIVDDNPKTKNAVRASIKDGVLTTDFFDFYMIVAKYSIIPTVSLEKAKLRLELREDRTAKGILGGYHDWVNLYGGFGRSGSALEVFSSHNVPGIYHALRKLADAAPDPKTGENTMISAAYTIETVPAFIQHSSDAQQVAATE